MSVDAAAQLIDPALVVHHPMLPAVWEVGNAFCTEGRPASARLPSSQAVSSFTTACQAGNSALHSDGNYGFCCVVVGARICLTRASRSATTSLNSSSL